MGAVRAFAANGGPVLGIQQLPDPVRGGLLPGVLRANDQLEFLCADVTVAVEVRATPFTSACVPGEEAH